MLKKDVNRKKRHFRIRKKVRGSSDIPRLSVKRSLANIYAQVIDDINARTLISTSTLSKEFKEKSMYGGNVKAAEVLGEILAEKIKAKGVQKICFDRGGWKYHGRVKALAETLRKNGIMV